MGTTSRYSLRETNRNEFTESVATERRPPPGVRADPNGASGSSARTSRRSSIPSTTARTTRRRSRTGGSCSRHAPCRSAWNRRRRRRRRPLRRASERTSQLTVRRWQPPQIPCSMRGRREVQEADSDGAHEPNLPRMHCGPSKALGGVPAGTAASRPTALRPGVRVRPRTRRRERAVESPEPTATGATSIDLSNRRAASMTTRNASRNSKPRSQHAMTRRAPSGREPVTMPFSISTLTKHPRQLFCGLSSVSKRLY